MNYRKDHIGINQKIRLVWLERTANLVLSGNNKAIIAEELKDVLKDKGQAKRGSRDKTISILLKVWFNVPSKLESFYTNGLELLKCLPNYQHVGIHWGMMLAIYPFWGAVASYTGRLLKLQRTAVAAQIQRRIKEQYGERESVSRSTRYVIRSFIDWGVLTETKEMGIYAQSNVISIDDPKLISWLIKADLHARKNGIADIKDLIESNSLFPFHISNISAEQLVSESPDLEILHHGINDNLIKINKENT